MDSHIVQCVKAADVSERNLADLGVILLASGSSKRMGQNKLMLPVGKAQTPCVRMVAEMLCGLGVGQIVVLYKEESVRQVLMDLPLKLIHNPRADLGQSEAIKAGIRSEWPENIRGWAFVMGDQPLLSSWVCRRLFSAYLAAAVDSSGSEVINGAVPLVSGQGRSPVIFSIRWAESLMALEGDQGAKRLLTSAGAAVLEVAFEDPMPFEDMDTPEAYERLRFK